MNCTARIAIAAVLAAILAGCVPKKIVWSPDGRRAAVVAARRLYLCDADGTLSAAVVDRVDGDTLAPVAWFPDSQRILVVREEKVRDWDEAATLMSETVREELIARAGRFREDLLAYEGDWGGFSSAALDNLTHEQGDAVRVYVKQHLAEGLAEHLSAEAWDAIAQASIEVQLLQVFDVHDDRATAGPQIVRVIGGITEVRISPDGKNVAYVGAPRETDPEGLPREAVDAPTLFVLPVDGGSGPQSVADYVGWFPDWSPDGTHLVYAKPNGPIPSDGDDLVLGTVTRRQVADADGSLLEKFGGTQPLAGIVFFPLTKVRCLADGRILFSAAEVHLPATGDDMPERASLFIVDPERHAMVTRIVPRQSEAHAVMETLAVGLFEPSPDGTRVAVAHEDGRVAIFHLNGGSVHVVQPDNEERRKYNPDLRTMPAWRSNEELCFAVPPGSAYGSPDRAEIVLWSDPNVRVLSRNWPAEGAGRLLAVRER